MLRVTPADGLWGASPPTILVRKVAMPAERNFLRASEILIQEHGNYTQYERFLLQIMLGRLSVKIHKGEDTEDPARS